MQWDAIPDRRLHDRRARGCRSSTPATRNVAAQRDDPHRCWRSTGGSSRRAAPRRRSARGAHRSIFGVAPDVLAWLREADGERVLVLLNVGDEARACDLGSARVGAAGEVVVGDRTSRRPGRPLRSRLEPLEGIAIRLEP